ncbi:MULTISPECIES: glycosyltransferase family 4 protein [unclassified Bifidobacterium]|uniref:glycosyltransferase family 4 protein n=1 Tax=unclassified Bifidobacterium TaxID=2608897 RepID=UPI00112E17C4|nr:MULTISPECIES: glycosyltransferase family 4 protein [unclassified Bifidobacterium]TPF78516.1 glycosyl transferase family 1 [Bifidobacterium sp. UTCIF-1]TPF80796.1 glycosyl transferase family 1 [Bifidobacterium sp. UTCIF-24]TPF82764.1 glycosyl transferase family 1 [Bifidobacterium sp. UTCIF-3]TPF84463.1 glycosyl transferase family 1 [Bifidobacterium sp. UTCIF-36]TPF90977.1 glycosyl transferase family 1 [Bifidobacterium sp. UTBIF-56]
MRIAFIGHKRIPSREGGVEVVVEELAVRMAALGHEVVVYNRRGHNVAGAQFDSSSNHSGEPYEYKGVHVVPVTTIDAKGLAALTSSFFATLKAIKARPDVIHYHAEGPCVPLRLAHWAGIRTVATIHGLDWQRAKWGRFASWYLKFGERTAAKCADEVIVLSRNVQQYFKDTYGRDVHFIPNGVERSTPMPADVITHKYGLNKDGYILFLGRIVPEKGVHYLIEAFKKLDTDKKLVIAGGSSDSAEYYESIKSAATSDSRIVLTGFIQGAELVELYSNAYIYVLPSDLEGMPMSLLEAMSYGNCCLTSDIPECTEVVRGHAVTFHKGGDADDLRATLAALINDPARVAALKAGAADYVTAKYSWDKVVDATLTLYRGSDAR